MAVARTLQTLLFEVKFTDAATCVEASIILVSVALLASIVPALRAARVDPITALRHE
jgi:putative ABC transport system permease protein